MKGIISKCNACFPPGWGGTVTDSIAQQAMAIPGDVAQVGSGKMIGGAVETTLGCNEAYDLPLSSVDDPTWFVVCGDIAGFSSVCPCLYLPKRASGNLLPGAPRGYGVPQEMMYDTTMVTCYLWPNNGTSCALAAGCSPFTTPEDVESFKTDSSVLHMTVLYIGSGA